jgi:hypothetical protein
MELINATKVDNTGKFNYHLKLLGDLIQKEVNDKYILTEKGQLAAQFLLKFPEKKSQPNNLNMADAALIGLTGFILTAANPALWIGLYIASLEMTLPFPLVLVFPFGALLYGFLVPSSAMWFLSIKRSHSHDMYSLFRAPLVTFVILLALVIVMLLTKVTITAEIKAPLVMIDQGVNWSHSSQFITGVSLAPLFIQELAFCFIGVACVELFSRCRRKRTLNHTQQSNFQRINPQNENNRNHNDFHV